MTLLGYLDTDFLRHKSLTCQHLSLTDLNCCESKQQHTEVCKGIYYCKWTIVSPHGHIIYYLLKVRPFLHALSLQSIHPSNRNEISNAFWHWSISVFDNLSYHVLLHRLTIDRTIRPYYIIKLAYSYSLSLFTTTKSLGASRFSIS